MMVKASGRRRMTRERDAWKLFDDTVLCPDAFHVSPETLKRVDKQRRNEGGSFLHGSFFRPEAGYAKRRQKETKGAVTLTAKRD